MPDPNTEHGLRVQLATALRERDEALAGRDAWKEACRKVEQERDSRDWTGLKSERDALRTALQEVNALLMSVPPGEDWRAVVREKVVTALHGEAAWERK